ncbi:hypothetical protein GTPT_1906 [Tatumella ptyseos ATCC 33301]|uniref:Uncharacterized protein n=1 Tax=Tatumella ptyseos ATCC 33301 TaxID=1005995 RepID=A0A085JF75_9GAMM|nr:hypothetical protein GTPT_1906 [Tatumella ptyseos ATCC 33301]
MAVENEIFFGNQDKNYCAFFMGVSQKEMAGFNSYCTA